MIKRLIVLSFALILGFILTPDIYSQTTEISYQGKLDNAGSPANGSYSFTLRLYDSGTFGNQLGNQLSRTNVNVVDGLFSFNNLNFGIPFENLNIWLEIDVRQGFIGEFTTLTPRQKITSAPTAIQSLNAANADRVGGLLPSLFVRTNDSSYVRTNDARLTDSRSPTSGSSFYIQNRTSEQASSNFRISGTGRADKLVAASNISLGTTNTANPLFVFGSGTDVGGTNGLDNVVGRFRSSSSANQTAISLDAASNRDTILYFSTEGLARWGIRNDESSNEFQVRFHSGGANTSLLRLNEIDNQAGAFEFTIEADTTNAKQIVAENLSLTNLDFVGTGPGSGRLLCVNTLGAVKRVGFCGVQPVPLTSASKDFEELKREIEKQEQLIKKQQREIDNLRKLESEIKVIKTFLCKTNPDFEVCNGSTNRILSSR